MKCIPATVVLLCYSLLLFGQQEDFVKNQGITLPLHESNKGKIVFTANAVTPADLKETDFLTTYNLTGKSNLFLTAFMDNSLTNYLHRLAPELSAEELYKNGNYQFSFYVDKQLIYKENLNYGAGLPKAKDSETVLSKPLINYFNMGAWWSQSMWNRFLNNGGQRAFTVGTHALSIEIRPYVKKEGLKVGDIIAAGVVELVIKKPEININKIRLTAVKPYDGLPVSKETYAINRIKELKGNIDEGVFKNITSVVVLKNKKLLIEEYFNGAGRDTLHNTRSVGKSFASTLAGIAIGDGYLKSENQKLKEFYDLKSFANYSVKKDNIAIRDLLTMSAAFDGNDDDPNSPGNEEKMYPTADWVKFTLDLPVDTVKHSGWHYFTAGAMLLGDILDKTVPGGLEGYADQKLFKPLHITAYKWQHTPQQVANTAGGLQMNALDLAKYGQLYKNGGSWNGIQIIPEEWVTRTFYKYLPIPKRSNEFYGYLFWNKTFHVKGKAYETYYCAGNGGNAIFIFKDRPLVIVVTATAYGTIYAHTQVSKMMEEYILPAIYD